MRRAVVVLILTAAVVVWLARYETRPPRTLNPNSALRELSRPGAVSTPRALARSAADPVARRTGVRSGTPGTRSATGPVITTPFSVIQVRAVLRGHRLAGVETVALSGSDPHTEALNARAEPILRESALKAGSARIDVVSGATYTSESWRDSLQAAIDSAR
jgi:uncharacterized protein with FMN-binding domain